MTTAVEQDIRDGGKELTLTLSGSTWVNSFRTNLQQHSNNPAASGAWVELTDGQAPVENYGLAPDGTMSAALFKASEAGGTSASVRWLEGTPYTNMEQSQYYMESIYIKWLSGDNNWAYFRTSSVTHEDQGSNYFDYKNGVLGTNAPAGFTGIEPASLTFPNAPDGWFRIYKRQAYGADFIGTYDLYQRRGDANSTGYRDGSEMLVWGHMVEPCESTSTRPSDLVVTGSSTPVTEDGFSSDAAEAIIAGLDSDGVEPTGWDAIVKAGLTQYDVARTSDTVCTITLPAFPNYDITVTENITATVPTTALNSGIGPVATPMFTVQFVEDDITIPGGFGAYNYYGAYLQRKRRRDQERRQRNDELAELESNDREIARLLHKQLDYERRTAEIAELEELVSALDVNAERRRLRAEANERIANAYTKAYMERTFSSLERFERQMLQAIEEEEFLLLVMSVL